MHHNQDWERWAAFMCLCFGQPYLYAEMTDLAIQLGTIKKVPDADTGRAEVPTNIHPGMMTPRSAGRPSSPSKYSVKYALSSDDNVPVYDATNQDVDFSVDLARLTRFPKWKGEIPGGSFIVTGYSASTYQTSVVKQGPKEEHVSCNLLWIIVCGIPKRT
ncbi:hypothetical protein C8R46DRAFT_1235464 [Mycena filopes]|nr:hypothetical protein C8R46DRAFT_1235464 [Mycena filopes]